MLEERTRESKREMDIIDGLEEIKEMNARNSKVDLDTLLQLKAQQERELAAQQLEEDEQKVKLIFGQGVGALSGVFNGLLLSWTNDIPT